MKRFASVMPCLSLCRGQVVKSLRFADVIDVGDPVAMAVHYEEAGADEIAVFDIMATFEQRPPAFDLLRLVSSVVKIPVLAGGGIRSLTDVELMLGAGAGKISLSAAAFRDSDFVAEAVKHFGGERIVTAIDAGLHEGMPSKREVLLEGGRLSTGVDAVEFARQMADLGVGSILPTSIWADGTKHGYDLDLTRLISDATSLPTVASGGAGRLIHFLEAVEEGHASALLAASVFHFGTFTVRQVKAYLAAQGVGVLNPPIAHL